MMRTKQLKRDVSSARGATIKAPESPRSEIREFGEAAEYMIEQMGKLYKHQALEYLNKGTVEKFSDAQSGNFAAIYLKQANRINRKLLKRFSEKRIKAMTEKFTGRVDRRNQQLLYSRMEKSVGISRQELEATEGLTFQINAYKLETEQWIKKLRDDTLQQFTSSTLRSMAEGKGLPEILSQFDDLVETRRGQAKMVARTQISTFNSLTTKARAQNLGIKSARWRTSEDERVRGNPSGRYPNAVPSHFKLNGVEFDLSKGALINGRFLLPGVDYNCRCDYDLIIPKMGD